MSVSPVLTPLIMCDECGRMVSKIWRLYRGHRYCGACYARVFKRRRCPSCHDYARLPKHVSGAVCRTCENNVPCSRCNVTGYAVAKITLYGPVCPSCAPYFREPKPCEQCGALSSRLTKVSRLGNGLKVCEKCARASHKTCVACRRHRLCEIDAAGRMLCSTCRQVGEKPCPTCGVQMPAGRGGECESCYWSGLAAKRVDLNARGFSHTAVRQSFQRFGLWLIDEMGAHKAALKLQRYVEFFQTIDQVWGHIPGYESLLVQFGAEGLRRVRLPVRWMTAAGLVCVEPDARRIDSERRAIEGLLSAFEAGSDANSMLSEFYQMLRRREAKSLISLRSIRLNLTPAVALLGQAAAIDVVLPTQETLNSYLAQRPGQRAALSAFVGYLRQQHAVALEVPRHSPRTPAQWRKQLRQKLLALLRDASSEPDFRVRWVSLGLAYFHDLPQWVGYQVSRDQVQLESDGGMTVLWNGHRYYLPVLVHEAAGLQV